MTSTTASVLPAEWAPQRAIQLTWPRPDGDFAHMFDAVERCFTDIAVAITRYEALIVACGDDVDALRQRLLAAGVVGERLHLYPAPADDVWARDHGPITVFRDGAPLHLDFVFNGWGGKFDAARDNQITRRLAAEGAWPAAVESVDFVLEGGAIESDGRGTLLTTERCLLAPTRNPQFDKQQIEQQLKTWFGLDRVLWLRHGDLIGDDTDGHIDTIARFCDADTIAYQACDDAQDPHYADLKAMERELQALRTASGEPYRLVPLPLPGAILDADSQRLPAGYPNFLILNGAVLVPTYADPADAVALERLRPCFPGRDVIGIDCRALIQQYGSLHCITMQIPESAA